MFGNNSSNTITVVSQSSYNITPFRYIRIKENGVYDGAALQVYIDDSTNIVQAYILSDNIQTDGWILKNWIPDATDPGNVNLYTNFTEKVKVDLDVSQQGGIITTGSVWSGGSLFANKGAKDANDLPSTWSDGMYFSQVYNNNFPCAYGTLLSIMRAKGNDGVQLLMEWKESDATSGSLFYRNKRDVGEDVWSPWSKVWSDTNHGSGSGLNADLLDGNHASAFALAGHNHDSSYSLITHDHNKFTKLSALNSSGTTLGTYNTISFNDEIKLRAGTNITLSINSNEITIDGTHNHDSIYSKKSGDTFTGPVNMSNLLTFGSGQDIAADAVSGTEPTQGIKFSADSDLYYIFMRTDNTNDKNGLIIQLGDNTDDYFQIEQVSPAGEASPTKLLKISESEGINTFTKLYTEQPITTKFATRSYLFKNVTYYYNGTANVTGTVKITMPGSWDATMMNIKIIGYDYSTNGAWELVVSGYNYDSSQNWLNCSAEIRGNAPFNQVRFAYDGSKNCLLLGTTSTVWQYPNLIVKEVAASFNTSTLSTWGSGWTASLITDESGITKIVTPNLRKTWHSENDGSESGLDADLIDGLHANVLGERYEINIGNSAGTRRWVRLATLDGLNSTGGANLEFILSGTGDFGSANRGIIFVQAGQRDTVISVMAYGLNFENTQDIVELYYKNLGSYKYEIWAKFADYNFMHYMTVLSKTNATINIDNIGTTAPTSPVSIAINKLWNSSNHGHGSGLDADTIDGKHSSDLVLKTGDTLTGTLTLKQDQFYESNSVSGINVNNSDIIGLNGLYFNDLVDSAGEGINFYRNTNIWDSLYLKNGEIYVHFNRLKGTNMSGVKVWHENNDGPNSGLDADTLDGQHASAFALVNHNHDSSYATIGHDHNKFTKLHALNSSETDIANSPYTAASSSDAIKLKAGTNITLSMSSNIVTIDATHNHDSVYAPNHTHSTLTINTNSDINNVAGGSYNTSSNVTATMFKPDQNINTNSTPQFARLGIGVAADSTYQLKLANGTILSGVSDSSSAVGFTFNTQSLSTSGAKIISLRNNGSERVYVDKDGNVSTSGIILSNRNKWQFAYSSVTLATASITPTPYDFLNGTIDNSFTLVDDTNNFDSILKSADYYIARLHTNVYCSSSKTISLSGMYADDTWAIYVNGNFIDGSTASCQTKNVSFTIPAGFSTIDIYFYEHVSTQSLKWTGTGAQKISDQVDYMFVENTFAPVLINSQPKMVAARITFGIGKSSATWTHNRNWSDYIVLLSTNSPEPHVYYSNKTSNSITINLDDEAYEQVIVDVILVMLESITSIMA
ncbi:MAG: hypothetical protein N2169_05220 [bacterium]|nr:hypothetical protein [bacterium]